MVKLGKKYPQKVCLRLQESKDLAFHKKRYPRLRILQSGIIILKCLTFSHSARSNSSLHLTTEGGKGKTAEISCSGKTIWGKYKCLYIHTHIYTHTE